MAASSIEPGGEQDATCFHCGLPIPVAAAYPVKYGAKTRETCCHGCQVVAQTIIDQGLGDYYRFRTALPESPQETVPAFLQQLSLYDNQDIQRSFVRQDGDDNREAVLILEGINCAACIWLNEQHIASLPGVVGVEINYSNQRARVRWDPTRIQLSAILKAITEIGYTAHPYEENVQYAIRDKARKVALRRLAIAGLGMMQVMMYALPVYLSGDGTMSPDIELLMRWASLVLTLPVVLYSAAPFFVNALRDMTNRRLGMDVPVAIGVGATFAVSFAHTLIGRGEVYFDSVAMFVFLLLLGRYLETAGRNKASEALDRLSQLMPTIASRLPKYPDSRIEEAIAVASLKPGDLVLIKPGESIPADGIVVEGKSSADESLLTGESRPVPKQKNDSLAGGTINGEGPVIMRVEKVGQDTVLSGIVRLLDRAQHEKPPIAKLADQASVYFISLLLLVAAAAGVGWYFLDPGRVLMIVVSILVVSCPCALSLATPAAITAATGALVRMGILMTRGHALETLAKVTDIVFDKTGTLTYGKLRIVSVTLFGKMDKQQCLEIAAALEQGSEHPVGKAIRESVKGKSAVEATDLGNVPGSGVEGSISHKRYRLGTIPFVKSLNGLPESGEVMESTHANETVVALGSESEWIALIRLGDELRLEAFEMVSHLMKSGKHIHLLSGDRPEAAMHVASQLGIVNARGGLSPEEKLQYVQELQQRGKVVAVVGDGVNDAPVLARAHVSMAMGGGTAIAQASADMVLASGRLDKVPDAVEMAIRTRRIIRQNLWWALFYNSLAIPAAITGHVTPWMAGLGMSVSSIVVVLNALRLARPGWGSSKFKEDIEGVNRVAGPAQAGA